MKATTVPPMTADDITDFLANLQNEIVDADTTIINGVYVSVIVNETNNAKYMYLSLMDHSLSVCREGIRVSAYGNDAIDIKWGNWEPCS